MIFTLMQRHAALADGCSGQASGCREERPLRGSYQLAFASANTCAVSRYLAFSALSTKKEPTARPSMFVRRKQSRACAGVFTTGSFSLNEVFTRTGTPLASALRFRSFQ